MELKRIRGLPCVTYRLSCEYRAPGPFFLPHRAGVLMVRIRWRASLYSSKQLERTRMMRCALLLPRPPAGLRVVAHLARHVARGFASLSCRSEMLAVVRHFFCASAPASASKEKCGEGSFAVVSHCTM